MSICQKPGASGPLLQVRDLAKSYGAQIGCREVTFDLWPGEVLLDNPARGWLREVVCQA